ncbi:MAG: hypothetical protein IIU14_02995 [Ruminococcus sp.]|nr:hypothetical protein [Ruminococcus sp.]
MSNGSMLDTLQFGAYAFAAAAILCLLTAEALFFSARKKPRKPEVPAAQPVYETSRLEGTGKTKELSRRPIRQAKKSPSNEFKIIKEVMLIHSDEEIT